MGKHAKLVAAAGILPLFMTMTSTAIAEDLADSAVGIWLREKKGWHVEFSMCDDKLCGVVVSGEGVDKNTGESVVGVRMLYDLEKNGENRWKGKMYNPGDGNIYKGKVIVLSENEVKMAGCMMGIICRSEKWPRVISPQPEEIVDEPAVAQEGNGG